jgi:uncharacterized protein YutE (UPF0331/DUF86 family)
VILRREAVEARLRELDEILQELGKYRDLSADDLRRDLSKRWIIERGLIAAASVIFDVADHILAGHFGAYPESYEESLRLLQERGVISEQLLSEVRGLGGLRNILIHRYLDIDPREVAANYAKGMSTFPRFAREVLAWLDAQG